MIIKVNKTDWACVVLSAMMNSERFEEFALTFETFSRYFFADGSVVEVYTDTPFKRAKIFATPKFANKIGKLVTTVICE